MRLLDELGLWDRFDALPRNEIHRVRLEFGGRSATYEKELQRAREIAIAELQQRATALGANAVVGIDLDYEVLGQGNGMLMVTASGTAVVID